MKIILLPLDERPCNCKYPQMHVGEDVLLLPPPSLLPNKKTPADTDGIWRFLEENIAGCDGLVVSLEMLVYGGLLASRLHSLPVEACVERLQRLQTLKAKAPGLKIYLSGLVMRCPAYSSGEEEPDYFAEYGEALFTIGALGNKKARVGLTADEEKKLAAAVETVPAWCRTDLEARRETNAAVLEHAVHMLEKGIIDYMVIPQDDAAPYSYASADQQRIYRLISQRNLWSKAHAYPGADEVACTLVTRMLHRQRGQSPRVFVAYSATDGASFVPKYEDRPFGESVKAHVLAQGASITPAYADAEYALFVNIPGKVMCEAWEQEEKDISYYTHRNLPAFVQSIQAAVADGKKCIVADVAFSNGGDRELLALLAGAGILDRLYGYAGWNTACNTLGTALSMAFLVNSEAHRRQLLAYRVCEDYLYQSIVRQEAIQEVLPRLGAGYYTLGDAQPQIEQELCTRLQAYWEKDFAHCFDGKLVIQAARLPWRRMFEIELNIDYNA